MLAANSKQTHVTKTPAKVQLRVHFNTIVADGVKALHKKKSRHRRRFAFGTAATTAIALHAGAASGEGSPVVKFQLRPMGAWTPRYGLANVSMPHKSCTSRDVLPEHRCEKPPVQVWRNSQIVHYTP